MSGPLGFERFNTSTESSRRGRFTRVSSGMLARLAGAPADLFSVLRTASGGFSASLALGQRLKLLAVLGVAFLISAYLGPGIALGGSDSSGETPEGREQTSGVDQYEQEADPDEEPEAAPRPALPPGTGEDRPYSASPAPKGSSGAGPGKRNTGGTRASFSSMTTAGESSRGVSTTGATVSYNAEPYCRTYERGREVRPSTKARAVFPLPEEYFDSYDDTWGAARPQGGHEGTDLMSPMGTPEYAITDGTVVPVSGSNANGWNSLGGYTVMIRAAHGIGPVKKGDLFYYAHMDRQSSLPIGAEVEAGDQVGVVGDTGYGPEGTRGQFPPHLHLGWYDTTGTTSEAPSGAMNPYPLLEWIKRNGGTAAGGWGSERASEQYCDYQERVAAEPPEANEGGDDGHDHGGPPAGSGGSADLDTGSADPRPSPVVERRDLRSHSHTHSHPHTHSHSHSRAVSHASQFDDGPTPRLPREGGIFADPRKERDPRPAPEPPPDGGRDAEPAAGGDQASTQPGKPDRTPERETVEPETIQPAPSFSRAPEEPDEPAPSGRPSPDGSTRTRPEPEPDRPEPDKSELATPVANPEPKESPRPSRIPDPAAPGPGRGDAPAGRGSILPVVFRDEDADSVRDAGEPELSGWSVEARGPRDADSTGESGYRIGGLEPGTYRVTVEAEEGYTPTTADTVRVRVGERREVRAAFGFAEPADLTVLLCGDARAAEPCIQEGGTPRGRELELRDAKGRLISAAATVRDDEHLFPDLLPGVYELIFAPHHGGSSGEPESRKLTLATGESRSVDLREKDPPEERNEKPPETSVEITREREIEEERP